MNNINKVLVINDLDTNIQYHKSDIDTVINIPELENDYNETIEQAIHHYTHYSNDECIETFKYAINLNKAFGFKHTIKINEYDKLFYINSIIGKFGYNLIDLFDFSNFINIIDGTGQIYKIGEKVNPVFLKITNYDLTDETVILMACRNNHYMSKMPLQWQIEYCENFHGNFIDNKSVYKDFDGYRNTDSMLKQAGKNIDNFPAIKYCISKKIKTQFGLYQGYLLTCGQLSFLWWTHSIINAIFKKYGFKAFPKDLKKINIWSSTEHSYEKSYVYADGAKYANKSEGYKVMPFFKLVSNNVSK